MYESIITCLKGKAFFMPPGSDGSKEYIFNVAKRVAIIITTGLYFND